jgi:hypothetical protein
MPQVGRLILDASYVPTDIKYPIDMGLLLDAIEKADEKGHHI